MGHFLECIPSSQGHSLAAAPHWGPGAQRAGGRVVDWSRRTPNQSELLCKKLDMEQKEKLLSPTSKLWNCQWYCSEGLTEWQRKPVWRETKQKQEHSEDRKVVPQVEYCGFSVSASKSFQKPCRISTLEFREKTLHDDGKDPLICLPLINFCYLAPCFGVPEDELETVLIWHWIIT